MNSCRPSVYKQMCPSEGARQGRANFKLLYLHRSSNVWTNIPLFTDSCQSSHRFTPQRRHLVACLPSPHWVGGLYHRACVSFPFSNIIVEQMAGHPSCLTSHTRPILCRATVSNGGGGNSGCDSVDTEPADRSTPELTWRRHTGRTEIPVRDSSATMRIPRNLSRLPYPSGSKK